MRIRKTVIAAVVLVFAGTSVLAACSSSEGSTPNAAGESLVVATSGTYKPVTFSDGGTLSGYDIDWANAVGEKLGRPVEFAEGQLSGLLTGLQSGQYDLVMSSLTITDERQKTIDFSDPYLADGVVAVVAESNSSISDVGDLTGLRVGVIGGSGYQSTVESIGDYSNLVEYPDAPSGFSDLKAGRIDVFAAGKIPATTFVENDTTGGAKLKIAGEPYALLPAGIGIQKGNSSLKSEIDKAIAELKAEGFGDKTAQKWFGFTIPGYTN